MLVLARRCGQKVRIETSDGVILIEVRKQSHKVSLGFEAPRTIKIVRDELEEKPEAVQA